ncbi:MAG: hypothetical protein J2P36_26595, partial [Ktedonobacteraceae bacterium]|nr:hypothetical protein [Ktedonobacteraceae bacterium]
MERPRKKLKNVHHVSQSENELMLEGGRKKPRRAGKARRRILVGLLCLLVAAGVTFGLGMWTSRYPDTLNMGTACNMDTMPQMNTSSTTCQASHGASN